MRRPRRLAGLGDTSGGFVPIAGVAIIGGFLPAYYPPIHGEYGDDDKA
ncbi:hypothetical protein [Micromonospora sp. NPDC004704]